MRLADPGRKKPDRARAGKSANGNVERALDQMRMEKKKLEKTLKAIERERDELKVELSTLQLTSEDDWDLERQENADLRKRITELAAQVTALTAAVEGDDSVINTILAEKNGDQPAASKAASAPPGGELPVPASSGEITSLAERIRALQLATK